jgi:hypothetical protein
MPYRNVRHWIVLAALIAVAGCAYGPETGADDEEASMDTVAGEYVKLVLAVGGHDGDYVDAYYGPDALRDDAESAAWNLEEIHSRATGLLEGLEGPAEDEDPLVQLRRQYLRTQIRALRSRVELLQGARMSFDEESRALYDATAPTHPDEHFQRLIDELDPLLPGEGTLIERYERFRSGFVIPTERLDAVFRRAIEACRERTARHIELPPGESFSIEYVTDKAWSGYNWYQGGFKSLIQVNTDLPIYIDRAVDLACHEGYPGHHVYNALLEKHLTVGRGWIEFSVYPLFSPQSLIAEGTANFGIEMAFPGDERLAFERAELFPLAGLDPASADRYYEVQARAEKLAYAGNEAARRYLNGEIDADQAAQYLARFALMPPARAEQRVRFIDKYRSYVINYNLGKDLVRGYIETSGGADPLKRWEVFADLLSSPRLPSGLQ